MQSFKFMGLDLSLTSTGYSIDGNTGTISTNLKGAERLSIVSDKIIELVVKNNVDFVVLEGYSFASRNSQAHSIGELGGAVRMKMWERGVRYIDVPPTCRAKFATGKGNAGKTEVISSISARTGRTFIGSGADDECDAWVLEQMGIAYIGASEYDWPQINLSALEKIDWSAVENAR